MDTPGRFSAMRESYDRSMDALRASHKRSRERQLRVNTDLRDTNVLQRDELNNLQGLVGLRNGEVFDLQRKIAEQNRRMVEAENNAARLQVSLNARQGQYDRQTNRLASAGIMLEDLRGAASKNRIRAAANREADATVHEQQMFQASLRYEALKDDMKEIATKSSASRSGLVNSMISDLRNINRIAEKG